MVRAGNPGGAREPDAGIQRLVSLIARLAKRRLNEEKLTKSSPRPIFFLCRDPEGDRFLELLNARLSGAERRQIPHAWVDAAEYRINNSHDHATEQLRALLRKLCERFSANAFGFARLKFRHFLLADWLMDQDLSNVALLNRSKDLTGRLRDHLGRWEEGLLADAAQQAQGPIHGIAASIARRLVPSFVFRIRISGRFPGSGREFHWFMGQRYVTPRLSRNFLEFAERLTKPTRDTEDAEQLRKLLVLAFLEDLRRAYDRKPWRPRAWRRTADPLALVDNIEADTAGELLLNLINIVRNETGQWDPLLFVTTCPADAVRGTAQSIDHIDDDTYHLWRERVAQDRRKHEAQPWYLRLRSRTVTDAAGLAQVPMRALTPRRHVFFVSRWAVTALCAVLLVVAAPFAYPTVNTMLTCGSSPFSGERVSVRLLGDVCIGFSDSEDYVFSESDQRLSEVQRRIFSQNRAAEELHEQQPERPFVSLIYLGQLTSIPSYSGQSEDLEGMAAAQRELINANANPRAPLLRIIVANAGPDVRHSLDVAEMLTPVVKQDPTIIGVVGMDQSRATMVNAIQHFGGLGLSVIGTSLSADNLYQASPLYFQIAPPNHEQAELIATVVADPRRLAGPPTAAPIVAGSPAYIYYQPDENDLYTTTMASDVAASLTRHGITVAYTGDWSNVTGMCQRRPRPTAIFAGRDSEFDSFLNTVVNTCGDNQPALIGDDSINRFMGSDELRAQAKFNRPLLFVAKSALVTCANKGAGHQTWSSFYTLLVQDTEWKPCDKSSLHRYGERTALTYDATSAFLRAVDSLLPYQSGDGVATKWQQPLPVTASTVWARLRQLPAFDGVTGVIDFARNTDPTTGYEPKNKRMAIVGVDKINDVATPPRPLFTCGIAATREPAAFDHESAGCPAPR